MHSSSETLVFQNPTRSQRQKNPRKSRIRDSILVTFVRGKHTFAMQNAKNRKVWGGFQFFTGPEKSPKVVLWDLLKP